MISVNPLNAGVLDWVTPSKPDDSSALTSPHDLPAGGTALALAGAPTRTAQGNGGSPLPADRSGSLLNRSLPARLLDTALRILHSVEGTRAETCRHHHADAADHERTQQLIRELGCMLNLTGVHHRASERDSAAEPAGADVASAELDANADAQTAPSLEIYLLSPFRVFANDRAIDEWPNGKGKSVFKYLATHRSQPVPKEVLMEVFWPDSDQDAARNNLNVAIYGLRKALARADPSYPFVLFRQGRYSFNPALRLWVDAEAFVECMHRAQAADQQGDAGTAMAAYRVAQAVYHSALLVDDRYEDWLIPQRQGLQDSYLKVLTRLAAHDFAREAFEACAASTAKMLEVDNCNEEAHRLLMRCYSRMGHTHLALRQYHFCVDALARELNLIPSPQTVALFQQIRRREPI
jgi:DNA-binding SARP family transcriptional activator